MILGLLAANGGVGRSKLALSLAKIAAEKKEVSLYELDVAQPKLISYFPWQGEEIKRKIAKVDPQKCTLAGKCFEVCQFKAIEKKDNRAQRNKAICRGCGLCREVCPERAVDFEEISAGQIGLAKKEKIVLYAGLLAPDQAWEGFLVRKIKEKFPLNGKEAIIKAPLGLGAESLRAVKEAQALVLITFESPILEEEVKIFAEIVQGFGLPGAVVVRTKTASTALKDLISAYGLSFVNLPWLSEIREEECFHEKDPALKEALGQLLRLGGDSL